MEKQDQLDYCIKGIGMHKFEDQRVYCNCGESERISFPLSSEVRKTPENRHDCIFKDDFEFAKIVPVFLEGNQKNKAFVKFWAFHRIKKYIHYHNLEFVGDMGDITQEKFRIILSGSILFIEKIILEKKYDDILFASRHDAKIVMEACREDLLLLNS